MPIKPGVMYELAPDGRVMLEMQDVMDMVADVRRLEWMAKGYRVINKIDNGYHKGYIVEWDFEWECYKEGTNFHDDWRDAIDEAMKNE
jgi:hypothetical protein